jgi:hypothetical protein
MKEPIFSFEREKKTPFFLLIGHPMHTQKKYLIRAVACLIN